MNTKLTKALNNKANLKQQALDIQQAIAVEREGRLPSVTRFTLEVVALFINIAIRTSELRTYPA
jgi:hypothetical protein